MKITILGSASGVAVPQRNASAYLLEMNHRSYLIDAGEGVAQQLVRYRTDQNQITCIFISHTHTDHVSGLFPLLQLMNLTGRKELLKIYIPQGLLPGFESIFPYFQIFRNKWPFQFELYPIGPGPVYQENGFRLSAIRNGHLSGNRQMANKEGIDCDSYSFRFYEKKENEVIYTSDVDSLSHLNITPGKVQILISECTHIRVEDIIDFAFNAGVSRVIFTHIPPEMEEKAIPEQRKLQHLNLIFAKDGMVVEV